MCDNKHVIMCKKYFQIWIWFSYHWWKCHFFSQNCQKFDKLFFKKIAIFLQCLKDTDQYLLSHRLSAWQKHIEGAWLTEGRNSIFGHFWILISKYSLHPNMPWTIETKLEHHPYHRYTKPTQNSFFFTVLCNT